ncbi:hypothetical protein BAE44_0023357 [Dichanthelium oligosanthes]|uniref:Uncharacterized protein n=1 Tax=Dichanthelium oligosanthes TaxID=888268 RepID=A0A1E5URY2_9POAL|nr:hypothetical protein BAE44_0023357 [Dichanthelium oligosanthes]
MLGIQVKLGVHNEARLLPSLIRCFPNTQTLYIQSVVDGRPVPNLKLWEELEPMDCVKLHLKKIVVRGFQGTRSELDFLKFIAKHA